jgi:hypothetical protein
MNSICKKIFGAGFILGLTSSSLLAQSGAAFGNLPLWFEAGQHETFIAHGRDSEFVISTAGAGFTLKKTGGETASCTLQFSGASPAGRISGDQMLAGKISHFNGNQPGQWQPGVPTFAKVRVDNVYPGINVVYYGNQKTLEYDFNLAAGVNPSVIALNFAGAEKISLDPQGGLVIKVNAGEILQHVPVAYQLVNGSRQEVAAAYKLVGTRSAAFVLGDYDHNQPLVIDPVVTYSTFYGGNYGETADAIAINPTDGSIYVAGQTYSTKVSNNIPFATSEAYQTNYHGGKLTGDAFVARFDNTGSNLIYATYLGGSGNDGALGLAVDAGGNAYVTGYTDSTNFPTTPSSLYPHIRSLYDKGAKTYAVDAFVTKLNPAGNALVYSTYLGGNSMDAAYGIALDAAHNAYVTGYTYSTNYPVTPNAFQSRLACSNTIYINANAFVSVVAADGGSLSYSTYMGGTNYDVGHAIAYNNSRVFVAGYTISTNFPITNFLAGFTALNGNTNYNKKLNGYPDAFVTAFDASTPSLSMLYSTFLGGTNNDVANSIAADAAGNAYVAGFTTSTNFPYTTTNVPGLSEAFVHTNDNSKHYVLATNGFLTKITWDGSRAAIGYSAMFGGKGANVANGVALDLNGNAYVVGSATCTNFPATTNNISGYLSATNSSKKKKNWSDAFVMAFNSDATTLLYSGYLGGIDQDYGNAVAVDAAGNAYVAGQTLSTNFPSLDAYKPYKTGTNDMFITKISPATSTNNPPALIITTGNSGQPGVTLKWPISSANYAVEGLADLTSGNWQAVPQNPVATNGFYELTLPATNGVQFFRLHQF